MEGIKTKSGDQLHIGKCNLAQQSGLWQSGLNASDVNVTQGDAGELPPLLVEKTECAASAVFVSAITQRRSNAPLLAAATQCATGHGGTRRREDD